MAAVDGDPAPRRPAPPRSSTCTRCTWPARSSSAGTARSGSSLFYLACAAAGSTGELRVRRRRAVGRCVRGGVRHVRRPAGGRADPPSGRSPEPRRSSASSMPGPHQHRVRLRSGGSIDNAAHLGGLAAGSVAGRARPADRRPDTVVAVAPARRVDGRPSAAPPRRATSSSSDSPSSASWSSPASRSGPISGSASRPRSRARRRRPGSRFARAPPRARA